MAKQYGVVGLGKMGSSIVCNLRKRDMSAVIYDLIPEHIAEWADAGVTGATSFAELVAALPTPRVIWMMVPADAVDSVIEQLRPHLGAGDVLVDGGNSFFRDSIRRAEDLRHDGIHLLDCGSSGGLGAADNGFCLMVGGETEAFALAEPLFQAIAHHDGYVHVGRSGAGHFVKMVHNAIEYGMLQAIGEGFELLEAGPYDVDLPRIAHLWNNGSVIRSWLLELTGRVLADDPRLESISGSIGGGSTGSWAIEEAWQAGIPLPSITMSYMMRLRSRQDATFTEKVVAALRREFGGHEVMEK